MESITMHQPTNSDEDLDDLQDGRTYECTYCKHGFTTAQALGGHMNVHRKDRAKSRCSSNNNTSTTANNIDLQPCLVLNQYHHREGQITNRDFMLSRSTPKIYDNIRHKHLNANGSTTSQAPEEIRLTLSLSLQFGQSHEEEIIQRGNEDDELDLELRLGYDP